MSRRDGSRPSENPRIRLYPEGPILVKGPVLLVDEHGTELSTRRTIVAVCRCGRSRMAPLCDGSHQRKRRPASA